MKNVLSRGGEEFIYCGRFSNKGVLQMRTSALFGAKKSGFFEIYGVSARTREVEPLRIFFKQRGMESIFHDFVRTSFMDGSKTNILQAEKRKLANFY